MKLNAIGVSSSNISDTLKFYEILGFKFPDYNGEDDHVESVIKEGETKLMIDSEKLLTEILGEKPLPSNHSAFAIEYASPNEVNKIAKSIQVAGYKVFKEPWDAFWGQRYSIVEDPDGYKIDLYAKL